MDIPKFKDGIVYFRNSEVKGLSRIYARTLYLILQDIYVLGICLNCLVEAILTNIHNICSMRK